ncbi:MAG TPA: hypothetical protein PKA55_18910 [Rhodoblastus sp.]|nr:hypothetical protein [Rhodoblastus sp.]
MGDAGQFAAKSAGLTTTGVAEVEALGLSLETLVQSVIDLDHRVYPIESHGHIGSAAQWTPIFAAHPETWRVLTAPGGEVVAYWQIAALAPARFAQASAGRLHPADLRCADYERLVAPGTHNMYFVSTCIDPAWRDQRTRWQLIDSLLEAIESLARRGVIFERVAATAHSPEGAWLCRAFGLAYLNDAPDRGACFGGGFADVIRRLGPALARRRPALAAAYGVDVSADTRRS